MTLSFVWPNLVAYETTNYQNNYYQHNGICVLTGLSSGSALLSILLWLIAKDETSNQTIELPGLVRVPT